MILSELLPFLESIGQRPKKGLSQNFLVDKNVVQKIVRTATVSPSDTVLEIGPGPGALTTALLDAGARVIAVEADFVLAQNLHRLQTPDNRLSVHHHDFLTFPLPSGPLKVVANLPYHITTPILAKLIDHAPLFSSLTFMVQTQVAERILAKPNTKAFSSLTLFLQFYTTPLHSFRVSSSCFFPKPTIDSTVLHLALHPPPLSNPAPFFTLMRRAFQQRRKTLSRSLNLPGIKEALLQSGLNPDARPEALSLDEWLSFYANLNPLLINLDKKYAP
jgi:16S rRNA (adenine1518-N6/adenine1519-N6)-dimethyltransferase